MPPVRDAAHDVLAPHLLDVQRDPAVVDQHAVAGLHVLGEAAVGDARALGRPCTVSVVRTKSVAAPQHRAAAGERAQADLRPLEVLEDRDRLPDPALHGPDALDRLPVLRVGAVGEVQAGHVHPGPGHLLDDALGDGRRADGADDLGEALLGHRQAALWAAKIGDAEARVTGPAGADAHVRRLPCPGCRSSRRSTRRPRGGGGAPRSAGRTGRAPGCSCRRRVRPSRTSSLSHSPTRSDPAIPIALQPAATQRPADARDRRPAGSCRPA